MDFLIYINIIDNKHSYFSKYTRYTIYIYNIQNILNSEKTEEYFSILYSDLSLRNIYGEWGVLFPIFSIFYRPIF